MQLDALLVHGRAGAAGLAEGLKAGLAFRIANWLGAGRTDERREVRKSIIE